MLTTSALEGEGIGELWEPVLAHQAHAEASGVGLAPRRGQAMAWMRELVAGLGRELTRDPAVVRAISDHEARVAESKYPRFPSRTIADVFFAGVTSVTAVAEKSIEYPGFH